MVTAAVPVVDMTAWWAGTPEGRAEVAAAVGRACTEIGFFALVGHDVDQVVIDMCRSAATGFFAQPMSDKMQVASGLPDALRGYAPPASNSVAYSMGEQAPPDLRESFGIGPVDVTDDPYFHAPEAGNNFAPNVWPQTVPGFNAALENYYRALTPLATELMSVFAAALGLVPDYFVRYIDRAISTLEIHNYPSLTSDPLPGQMRVGAHSDYGSLTILLHEDSPGGLQVQSNDGTWVDVPSIPGGFVVNIGDLMAQWTNDRWTSTKHRVVPPPTVGGDTGRLSIVYFHQPNYDALIECLPEFEHAGEPKYAPVTSGAYLAQKMARVPVTAA